MCGNGSSIFERSEYSEACRSIGMAVPRGLLRGYGDRREEASFASESVDYIKKQYNNKNTKAVKYWPGDGSSLIYMLDM